MGPETGQHGLALVDTHLTGLRFEYPNQLVDIFSAV